MRLVREHTELKEVFTLSFPKWLSWIKWIKIELVNKFPDDLTQFNGNPLILKWDFKGQHNVKIVISFKPPFLVFKFGLFIY